VKEQPILFSGPMVRAILDGAKTQTRRLVKLRDFGSSDEPGFDFSFLGRGDWTRHHTTETLLGLRAPVRVGDTLWVKETWRTSLYYDDQPPRETAHHGLPFWYDADGSVRWTGATIGGPAFTTPGKTRVSIHMPRWASRLTLRVTDVRVERLGDISAEDCVAEGAMHWCEDSDVLRPREAFRALWEHVHGADAWERDVLRWVWVYSFEVEGRDAVS
jgi:hypothetical protein